MIFFAKKSIFVEVSEFRKYILNPETLLFEIKEVSLKHRFFKSLALFLGSIALALVYCWIYVFVLKYDLPKTALLKKANARWISKMELMDHNMDRIDDALAGKIDLIITKAVSRFARNLMDCIVWVEALKNHDPPIRVFFEQEHLDTMAQTSGIILFVLAMVAEEESHMKSEAMLLSLEWRFSWGRFITPSLLGYDRAEVPDGQGSHKKGAGRQRG